MLLSDDDTSDSSSVFKDDRTRTKSPTADISIDGQHHTIPSTPSSSPAHSDDGWHDIDELLKLPQFLRPSERTPHTSESVRLHTSSPLSATTTRPCDQPSDCPLTGRCAVDEYEELHTMGSGVYCGKDKNQQEQEDEEEEEQQMEEDTGALLKTSQIGGTRLFKDSGPLMLPVQDDYKDYDDDEPDSNPKSNTLDMETCLASEHELVKEGKLGTSDYISEELYPTNNQPPLDINPLDKGYRCQHKVGQGEDDVDDEADGNSNSESEDELTSPVYSSGDPFKRRHPLKRKRQKQESSSSPKKQKNLRQQPRSHQHGIQFPSDQSSQLIAASSTAAQLPSLAVSSTGPFDTDLVYDGIVDSLPRDERPVLLELTLRPHSSHCSFTAIVQEDYKGQGISFNQATKLIASAGIVVRIEDLTIRPLHQRLFSLSGFTRRLQPPPSRDMDSLKTSLQPSCFRSEGASVRDRNSGLKDTVGTTSETLKSLISDVDDGSLSSDEDDEDDDDDSDGGGGGDLSDAGQGASSTKSPNWSDLEKARLKAYKKEGKDWGWIFRKFPGRTENAVRTRWSLIRDDRA